MHRMSWGSEDGSAVVDFSVTDEDWERHKPIRSSRPNSEAADLVPADEEFEKELPKYLKDLYGIEAPDPMTNDHAEDVSPKQPDLNKT